MHTGYILLVSKDVTYLYKWMKRKLKLASISPLPKDFSSVCRMVQDHYPCWENANFLVPHQTYWIQVSWGGNQGIYLANKLPHVLLRYTALGKPPLQMQSLTFNFPCSTKATIPSLKKGIFLIGLMSLTFATNWILNTVSYKKPC